MFLHRILDLLQLRREEASTAMLMSSYFFLALTCTSIIKSLQNSLYLSRIGFDWQLPLLYVGIALLSGPVILTYRYLAKQGYRFVLGYATLIFFMASVLGFFFLLQLEPAWIYPLFYTWGGVFTILLPIQGWMLSYELYRTSEAKRLYALLGTGGILGGAFGGFYTAGLANPQANEGLLLHVCLFLVGATLILSLIYRRHFQRVSSKRPGSEPVRKKQDRFATARRVVRSDYLRQLALLILFTGAVTTLVDLLYKWGLERHYTGSELAITQFFAVVTGTMFVFSALLQLVGTSRFLRRFGIGIGLLVLPASLFVGAFAVAITAAFWALIGLKVIDGSLRTSIERTSVELLYMPLGSEMTAPIKSFIDLGAFRAGDAVGASLFLIISLGPLDTLQVAGIVIMASGAIWLYISFRLGREYLNTLRRSLGEVGTRPSGGRWSQSRAPQALLLEALESPYPGKVHLALQQFMLKDPGSIEHNFEFSGQDEETMQSTLSGLSQISVPSWIERVRELADHPDPGVASAALHLLLTHQPHKYASYLEAAFGGNTVPEERLLLYLDRYRDDPDRFLTEDRVKKWAEQADDRRAVILARLMGKVGAAEFKDILLPWTRSPDHSRARSAIRALGPFRDAELQAALIAYLKLNWSRPAAEKALGFYGDAIIPRLVELLRDSSMDSRVRRVIPRILARIHSAAARDALIASLYLPDSTIAFVSLKVLNKMRQRQGLLVSQETLLPLLQIWTRQYYELVYVNDSMADHRGRACRLLAKALQERIDWKLEKIFRALGLFLPGEDIFLSYRGYISRQEVLRESAMELVDSHIKGELRISLKPLFTEQTPREMALKGQSLFAFPRDSHLLLSDMLKADDPWLKCCIIAAVVTHSMDPLKPEVDRALQDSHPMVRETAEWAVNSWGSPKLRNYRC